MTPKELIEIEAKKIAEQIYIDCFDDRKAVGGSDEQDIDINGVMFTVTVSAFWESAKHFDYEATQKDGNDHYKGLIFDF